MLTFINVTASVNVLMTRMLPILFLSHAAVDAKLAAQLTRLLAAGLDITGKQVFCSSLPGRTIPGGFNFVTKIKESLENSKVVVLLITENYIASQFCLAEIGAAWISKETVIPIVVPPYSRSKLEATLSITQAWRIDDDDDLNSFADDLAKALEIKVNNAQWGVEKKAFLEGIQKAISNQKPPTIIDPIDYVKLEKELNYSQKALAKQRTELETKNKLIEKLKKLKNSGEVRAIEIASLDEMEGFNQLTTELGHVLEDLPSAVREAIFHSVRGENLPTPEPGYSDSDDKWKEIKTACKKNMLSEDLSLKEDHPKVKKALKAVSKLSAFMDENEDTLRDLIEAEHEITYSLQDEDFWSQLIR